MSTISFHIPEFLSFPHDGFKTQQHKFSRMGVSLAMAMDSGSSEKSTRMKEELSVQVPTPSNPELHSQRLPDLQFDRLQLPEMETANENKFDFGQFVAREAMIDEEYWAAAWLRAESHWEDRMAERYVENYKRKFAEQEFHAIKRRRTSIHGQQCRCIVTVRKEDKNVKCTALKSVVGTLDLSIRCLLHGETFPGEQVKAPPPFCNIDGTGPNRYGYVANLCVTKPARRVGVASNMLQFAIAMVKSNGLENVYVHVHRNNKPAQDLYQKMGFEIVEVATPQLSEEQLYLLCCKPQVFCSRTKLFGKTNRFAQKNCSIQ